MACACVKRSSISATCSYNTANWYVSYRIWSRLKPVAATVTVLSTTSCMLPGIIGWLCLVLRLNFAFACTRLWYTRSSDIGPARRLGVPFMDAVLSESFEEHFCEVWYHPVDASVHGSHTRHHAWCLWVCYTLRNLPRVLVCILLIILMHNIAIRTTTHACSSIFLCQQSVSATCSPFRATINSQTLSSGICIYHY